MRRIRRVPDDSGLFLVCGCVVGVVLTFLLVRRPLLPTIGGFVIAPGVIVHGYDILPLPGADSGLVSPPPAP